MNEESALKKILFAFGTRPEAIKMAPLVREFQSRVSSFKVVVCVTGQHRQMLDHVLHTFCIVPDYDLNVMQPGQSLSGLTSAILAGFDKVLETEKPDIVMVQGDTTTSLACGLAAFYRSIKVAHVEAGLRTEDRLSPFPEEANRRMTTVLSDWHFAPTRKAGDALLAERVDANRVYVTGNTVIDALLSAVKKVRAEPGHYGEKFAFLANDKRLVLITGHRRESFGEGMDAICKAIRRLAQAHNGVIFTYAVHLNPLVQAPVTQILSDVENVKLIAPQEYLDFVWLIDRSHLVLTDSGGIQEEAPSLGKPVVVMREITERMEAVEAGSAVLAGNREQGIFDAVNTLLLDDSRYSSMANVVNPFGDGTSSRQIADILSQ